MPFLFFPNICVKPTPPVNRGPVQTGIYDASRFATRSLFLTGLATTP